MKQSGVIAGMLCHTGPARVFECEEALQDSLHSQPINPGDVLVIRNEGPRGGPGMRELSIPAAILTGMGLNELGGDDHRWALFRCNPADPASVI